MRVRLQNLDHLSEIPVVVQPGVLRGQQREDEGDNINSSWLRAEPNLPQSPPL